MATLEQHLRRYPVDRLRALASYCGLSTEASKAALIRQIAERIRDDATLRAEWERMDPTSRQMVMEAVHCGGVLRRAAYFAKYDRHALRLWPDRVSKDEVLPIDLILHHDEVPDDLLELLKTWVPAPRPFEIQGERDTPQHFVCGSHIYALLKAETALVGPHDLSTLLRGVADATVRIDRRTLIPTAPGASDLISSLEQRDFLAHDRTANVRETIRPVGLARFAAQGGLIAPIPHQRGLWRLTEEGSRWLDTGDREILREALWRWAHADHVDELDRIESLHRPAIRQARLSSPSLRRTRILQALQQCPSDVWIHVEDFFKGVIIWGFDFPVETGGRIYLYVGNSPEYGWLGYSGVSYWRVVNGLYILQVLWETLATVGAIDILYVQPERAHFNALVFGYAHPYFSRYDGLKYFRINSLGAYLLRDGAAAASSSAGETTAQPAVQGPLSSNS